MNELEIALDKAFDNLMQKGKKLTMEDCKPCPKCKNDFITFAKFTQYRPKEAIGKCHDCGYYLPIKGNHTHKLIKVWNENFYKVQANNNGTN